MDWCIDEMDWRAAEEVIGGKCRVAEVINRKSVKVEGFEK